MLKVNPFSFIIILLLVTQLFASKKSFGQMVPEKDILLTEYPIYFDGLRNTLEEAQINDRFIVENKVKILTQSMRYKQNHFDSILPIQQIFYDTVGRIIKRELFYFGRLFRTSYFTYDKDTMTVIDESLENKNKKLLLYKVQFDTKGNPIKYIRYQVYNHENGLDGLDSVTYHYTYDPQNGNILIKKPRFFTRQPEEWRYSELIFKYKYSKSGQNIGYSVFNPPKRIYTVENRFTQGVLTEKHATYNLYDIGKHYFDSTKYFYGENHKLNLIKLTYLHDPLSSQSDERLIKFDYDKNGLLSEEYTLPFKEKKPLFWYFYK